MLRLGRVQLDLVDRVLRLDAGVPVLRAPELDAEALGGRGPVREEAAGVAQAAELLAVAGLSPALLEAVEAPARHLVVIDLLLLFIYY